MQSVITSHGEKTFAVIKEYGLVILYRKSSISAHTSPEMFYKKVRLGGAISQQGICEVEPKGFLSVLLKDGMRPVGAE